MERRFVVDGILTLLIGLEDFLSKINTDRTYTQYDERGLCDSIHLVMNDDTEFIIEVKEK